MRITIKASNSYGLIETFTMTDQGMSHKIEEGKMPYFGMDRLINITDRFPQHYPLTYNQMKASMSRLMSYLILMGEEDDRFDIEFL